MPIVHDVPMPNGLLAMRVAVTRLTDMPGWSKVETWDGAGCGLSPHDFDGQERRAAGQVMRAALVIALHLLPPGDIAPLHGSFGVSPLPDRLADLTALGDGGRAGRFERKPPSPDRADRGKRTARGSHAAAGRGAR